MLLVIGCRAAKLPLNINWNFFIASYWGGLAVRALFLATLLYVIGFPAAETVVPVWKRYCSEKARYLVFAVFAAWMILQFGFELGLMIVVDGIALAELIDRTNGSLDRIKGALSSVLPSAIYLFFGLVAMFCANDLIASVRVIWAYDDLFLKIDSWMLHGHSISALAHWVAANVNVRVFDFAEFIYYGMFAQIGAALILISMWCGKKESLRYAGTILTAYVIALVIFYFWPSMGPFFTCSSHFAVFPKSLATYNIQQTAILKAKLLRTSYKQFNQISSDYFIAFPCMHIAQPLVVLWSLRRWKRIAIFLIVYDLLLIPAILVLEWHYVCDVVAGILVAVVAISLNEKRGSFAHQQSSNATEIRDSAEIPTHSARD